MNVLAEKVADDGTKVRVLEFPELKGSDDPTLAQALFFAQQTGMTAKLVEITLQNGTCTLEPGALYFMKGSLELTTGTGGGILSGIARSVLSGETLVLNTIKGTGVIYLEPTFGHIMLHDVRGDEKAVVADQGSFFASTGGIKATAARVRSISGMALGGEGLFQTQITGVGIAILRIPVPENEIAIVKVDGDTLHVDGNFAVLRSIGVTFQVRKASRSWIGTALSGEGFMNVYGGKGRVWMAPTQGVYERIRRLGVTHAAAQGSDRNQG
jgi:uncharacterized protein (AIM24 family)